MMAFFEITESQQGLILTLQAIGTLAASVYLALFGERHNKIYVVCFGMGILTLCALAIHLLPVWYPAGRAISRCWASCLPAAWAIPASI